MPSNPVKPFQFVFYLQINSALGKQKRERETARKRDRTPAPASSRCLNHHRDRTPAPARSHTTMSSEPHPIYPKKHNPIPISANPHPPCSIHTHPISRRLKHHRDRTHDPPMPDLSLSRSTSPFPSLVDHTLFLLLFV